MTAQWDTNKEPFHIFFLHSSLIPFSAFLSSYNCSVVLFLVFLDLKWLSCGLSLSGPQRRLPHHYITTPFLCLTVNNFRSYFKFQFCFLLIWLEFHKRQEQHKPTMFPPSRLFPRSWSTLVTTSTLLPIISTTHFSDCPPPWLLCLLSSSLVRAKASFTAHKNTTKLKAEQLVSLLFVGLSCICASAYVCVLIVRWCLLCCPAPSDISSKCYFSHQKLMKGKMSNFIKRKYWSLTKQKWAKGNERKSQNIKSALFDHWK